MRIVGGIWRGRAIKAPEGRDTRPTTDRIRESVASIVLSDLGDLGDVAVLDAFGGSGALAFEMLSRGARSATVCDADPRAVRCIRENAEHLGVSAPSLRVLKGDVLALARRGRMGGAPFGLVLLDPPYAMDAQAVSGLIDDLAASGSLAPGALVVYERDVRSPQLSCPALVPARCRTYGTTAVDTLHYDPEAPAGEPSAGGAGTTEEER